MAANSATPENSLGSRMTAARIIRGAISLSSSSHFAQILYSNIVNPVVLPPGRDRLATRPRLTGSLAPTNTMGMSRVTRCRAPTAVPPTARRALAQRAPPRRCDSARHRCAPAIVDLKIAAGYPPVHFERFGKGRGFLATLRITTAHVREHADAPDPIGLLRPCRGWPCRRAAEQRNELAPPHSITSSAIASRDGGTIRLSMVAV